MTVSRTAARDSAVAAHSADHTRWFYVWMAAATLGIAVGGWWYAIADFLARFSG